MVLYNFSCPACDNKKNVIIKLQYFYNPSNDFQMKIYFSDCENCHTQVPIDIESEQKELERMLIECE